MRHWLLWCTIGALSLASFALGTLLQGVANLVLFSLLGWVVQGIIRPGAK